MSDHAAAYGPDILLALVSTATFGGWGLAGAAVISLARHSPVVQEGVAQLGPQVAEWRRQLPEMLSATPHDRALVRRPAPRAQAEPNSAPPTAAAPRPRSVDPRPLTPDEFARDPLFVALNEEPHRLVIGHTQGGKSTALHGMAMAWAVQGHSVMVLDPDAARGQWPGCEVAGYAEDYRGIGQALDRVRDVFEERSQLYADGQRDFAPYYIVADEVHETIRNVPNARDFLFETVARRGAKRGIFLTLGTQGNNADELDLDSAGVLNNFITVEFDKGERGRRVATVYRGNAARKKNMKQYLVPPLPGAKTFVAAVAADAPRPEVVSVRMPERPASSASGEAGLLAELPAEVRAQVPDISPEREARLARALEASTQRVTVERGGGDVHVHVQQVSAQAPTGRARASRSGGVNARKMRERADKYRKVEAAILAGKSANEAQVEAQVKRETAQQIARQVRARHGLTGGSRRAVPGSRNQQGTGTGAGSEAS